MVLMESPAVLVAVLLARRHGAVAPSAPERRARSLFAESFSSGPVLLLLGSFAIGAIGGEKGWSSVEAFAHVPFKGVLCLFLLDLGLVAARRLGDLCGSGPSTLAYAVLAPLAHAAIAIAASSALGLGTGDALLLTVLFASASYIAVPAAMRMLLPQANPGIHLPMALAITFPLNIAVGMPLDTAVIEGLRHIA